MSETKDLATPTTIALVKQSTVPEQLQKLPAFSLAPRTFDEAVRFSKMLADSDLAPKDFKGRPANVLIAIQMGAEVGLAPMAAIQNIAVINGRPSLWGDAALAVVQAHRDFESIKEYSEGQGENKIAICEIKRKGHDLHAIRFGISDAKKAGLWGKAGPWTQYPDRMLQMRARGFAIRDKFADALRGLNIGEESMDLPVIDAASTSEQSAVVQAADPVKDEIEALLTSIGMNEANRIAILGGATSETAAQMLEALKAIKFVLTAQNIPVQQWLAPIQKHSRNLPAYAAELKQAHEKKINGNGNGNHAEPVQASAAGSQPEQRKPAGQDGTVQGTPSRPAAGPEQTTFITEEDTAPPKRTATAKAAGKRFAF